MHKLSWPRIHAHSQFTGVHGREFPNILLLTVCVLLTTRRWVMKRIRQKQNALHASSCDESLHTTGTDREADTQRATLEKKTEQRKKKQKTEGMDEKCE